MLNATIIVLPAATPWWQILIQVIAPLVAIGIAVGSALRDNRLRRESVKVAEDRETEFALVRARRVLHRTASIAHTGTSQLTSIRVENTNDAPIYDLRISRATMDGAPAGVLWHPEEESGGGYVQHLPSGGEATIRGEWWRPGEPGKMERVDLGFSRTVRPIMFWHDESGRKFKKDGDGQVKLIQESATSD